METPSAALRIGRVVASDGGRGRAARDPKAASGSRGRAAPVTEHGGSAERGVRAARSRIAPCRSRRESPHGVRDAWGESGSPGRGARRGAFDSRRPGPPSAPGWGPRDRGGGTARPRTVRGGPSRWGSRCERGASRERQRSADAPRPDDVPGGPKSERRSLSRRSTTDPARPLETLRMPGVSLPR